MTRNTTLTLDEAIKHAEMMVLECVFGMMNATAQQKIDHGLEVRLQQWRLYLRQLLDRKHNTQPL